MSLRYYDKAPCAGGGHFVTCDRFAWLPIGIVPTNGRGNAKPNTKHEVIAVRAGRL